ncbi:MAG: XdhC family protein [Deltaproteobacteria bacterium]|nr:XdhC family protein [Deltaproteobacteria bacterium]
MEPVDSEMKAIAQRIQRLIDEEESGALVLVIGKQGSSPGKIGAKMLVLPDGGIMGTIGGGVIEARVLADALNSLEDGKGPRTLQYNLEKLGMDCGGAITVYIEPMLAPRRIVIFGAGHVGAAVARMLKTLGCHVRVIDEREEWASSERLPGVDEIVNEPFDAYLKARPPTPRDHVIIVTRGHEQDQLVLEAVVGRKPVYLGMIGSRKKAKAALKVLQDKGVPADRLQSIRSPIGLDIGAVTPDEIAVSVAAELIALWRHGALPSRPGIREVAKEEDISA